MFSPTCLSDRHLHRSGGWTLSDDVVACHNNLVVFKLLQFCKNKNIFMCKTYMQSIYQVNWNKIWNRQIAGALLPSSVWNNLRVNSNSVSEALLTVLKVLLAWEEWEKKRRMSKSMHVSSSTIHCAIIMPFKKKKRRKKKTALRGERSIPPSTLDGKRLVVQRIKIF